MTTRPKIILHLGGHDFHPVYDQASALADWLADDAWCHRAESLAALEHSGECDLLVFIGMYFSGWHGRYRPPGDVHKRALERYVTSGKPMILCHGAVASYDDWPRFGELVGFSVSPREAVFADVGTVNVRVAPEAHAVTAGVVNHEVFDAPVAGLRVAPDIRPRVHASVDSPAGPLPMLVTGEGGRVAGAGKTAYIGYGHDLRAFAHPSARRLWLNTVRWCLSKS